ncbi:nucleotidyltransferase domain-containing protein [Desulfoglaeba alkanexedens]|uniref:Nucleotidyltransferase domain-containing protein n=1 Tax=Desulfoglaeba alkanexedens ALDC TaxID=980445 RepID=A0A4P8L0X6_9BACT|nr:nucleotidyltransferase domain-containing protein [Desulfoglaeba alkanexedens]QCQ21390.1 nucleotidyltransferase domain-containing protein [Desulfoglaeba alkanexedens ALDC]
MNREELLEQIKEAVHQAEPDAEIILYGCRSRGDALSESDWDFLILVDGPVSDERTDRIRHRLYELEWETGEVISSIVRNHDEWNSDIRI